MPASTYGARSGVCEGCQAKYTLVLTIEHAGKGRVGNVAPFTCPKCNHGGTVTAEAGERIVKVEVKPYSDVFGH